MSTDQEPTELETDRTDPSDFSGNARAYLVVQRGERVEVVEVPDGKEVVIGRGTESHVAIDDARASRRHARVFWSAGQLLIEDLQSRNGTLVNTQELRGASRPVGAGDTLRVGGLEVVVAVVSAASQGLEREPVSKPSRPPSAATEELPASLNGVVVADANMSRMFGFARRIARANTTVLILGETGSGKEVVAQQIHAWSRRAGAPFVRVNCATLQESLAESELFGYERGAFTGADRRKVGFAEAANGGTLFLDELGELSLPVQAKLLAMLENRAIIRVGSAVETPVDVRVISATHRDLNSEIAAGRFREDLFYRLGVVVVRVPPLRERPSEVVLLAKLFAKRFGADFGWKDPVFAQEASAALAAYKWPGNVRELRNAIEHAMLVTDDGTIRAEHLPETLTRPSMVPPADEDEVGGVKAAMSKLERETIAEALRAEQGNRTRAARRIGISLRSLLYKIDKYKLK
ncbi:MAG TPA: sigma 54-interacting transcriptional regulator [Polyangiaceae bacterium]|nr:sigma 54-interacting transcriptional regulator [Polyangiaceae bacterium]